ncbi:MAG: outer membrane lipoprotein carrier protein LolA [Bacteroidota bacterium]|nr:outer membrane lipoprotein carrier protein LolA [Bacteroidota bacterium]
MKTINWILFFLLTSTYAFSQENNALEILQNLEQQQENFKNISLEFEFITQSEYINEKQKGKLILEGHKSILEFNQQLSVCNGKTKWIYLKNMNEIQIIKYDPNEDVINMNTIFSIYRQGDKYNYINKEKSKNGNYHVIDVIMNKNMPFKKVRLEIIEMNQQIQTLYFYHKNETIYIYNITTFKTDIETPDFDLDTDKYPEAEIIDLR